MNVNNSTLFNMETAQLAPLDLVSHSSGYIFIFKVSGEMKVYHGENERSFKAGRAAVLSLDGDRRFVDRGATAFFIVNGTLCDMLMEMHGVTEGVSVYAPLCAESFFETVRAFSKYGDSSKTLYAFHGVLAQLEEALTSASVQKADVPQLIKDYIDASAGEKVTLDKMSELFFLSKSQIFRIFKARYGIPPMQYYIDKKLEYVKRLLHSTDMRIADIAEELGFSDAKHLTKTFKNAFGQLPKDYRREIRAESSALSE